ncbi:phosphomannomutase [Pseudoroseicyclus aestuarii]|uniref:Phosphomannomutase n=1 Tax=Pseudoroseicyclus aestuarii TaxID=1795041 RepID=A0A318T7Z7_9RHOB|nr:phosphomannomutase [Pseudoroseicyclus aestuarii]PYE84518.1 phosphomannomutase [Pseudoroseicyclus aestuarii]
MPPKFGTSGLRGLVTELTDALVAAHVRAFLAACPHGGGVHVGRDLRASSPRIGQTVLAAVREAGLEATDCGAVPTPALALAAMGRGQAAIMVTGSHIPDDRNGLKFYLPTGEIAKSDEAAILAALEQAETGGGTTGPLQEDPGCGAAYATRYTEAFGPRALEGLRIGVYQHSSVARDLLAEVLQALGAVCVPLARSEVFVPVDTEAVDPALRDLLPAWTAQHGLDAVVSTDGDGDRPLLADGAGQVLPGDVLGPLTARMLGAKALVTPVSSNTLVEAMGDFAVTRTRIGSPHVIAGMEAALRDDPQARVAGYEANGGFLLGFEAQGPAGPLPPLMTRDALLPLIAPLAAARAAGQSLAQLAAALPARFTASGRVTGIDTQAAAALIAALEAEPEARAAFFETGAPEQALDLTDGLRVLFESGEVVHLRPSGNAPEMRCYAEAASAPRAEALMTAHLDRLDQRLSRG